MTLANVIEVVVVSGLRTPWTEYAPVARMRAISSPRSALGQNRSYWISPWRFYGALAVWGNDSVVAPRVVLLARVNGARGCFPLSPNLPTTRKFSANHGSLDGLYEL